MHDVLANIVGKMYLRKRATRHYFNWHGTFAYSMNYEAAIQTGQNGRREN